MTGTLDGGLKQSYAHHRAPDAEWRGSRSPALFTFPDGSPQRNLTIGYFETIEISGGTENGQEEGLKCVTGRLRIILVS
jgi:hypothetical protein